MWEFCFRGTIPDPEFRQTRYYAQLPASPAIAMTTLDEHAEDSYLVQTCLTRRPFAWQRFVDRFLPAVLMAIQELDTQSNRGWTESDHQDLARSVFLHLKKDDFELLRKWQPDNDFETWLVIVARRIALGQTAPQNVSSEQTNGDDRANPESTE